MSRARVASVIVVAALIVGVHVAAQQTPTFQSNVEVTSIDVGVVDASGRPIEDLGPGDFTARIDGQARKVISAQWVPLVYDAATPREPLPEGFSSNENKTPGRLIVLAIDDANVRFGGMTRIQRAAAAFIDSLAPPDRVSVVGFGNGSPSTPFLTDLQQARQFVSRITGQRTLDRPAMFTIALTEARAIFRGDQATLSRVVSRECAQVPRRTQAYIECTGQVEEESDQMALAADERGLAALRGLSSVFGGLRSIDAPKTVVFLSEGFIIDDFQNSASEIGAMAAAAHATLYVLQMDDEDDLSNRRSQGGTSDDRQMRTAELEALASAARGQVFRVTGNGTAAFDRVKSELTGYYMLGVQSDPRDRDGKGHPIRIDVSRNGAVVRSRQQLLNASAARPGSQQQAAASGLVSPLPLAALPVRVATFALQGPERGKAQMLIHAEVGNDYSGPRVVSIAYAIFNKGGQAIESHLFDARLQPEVNGVPAPLVFATGASLPIGEYTLKFVASEGDRAGSVEHPVHANLLEASGVNLSELMVGGPSSSREILQPTVGNSVNFGVVHGYLEAYGSQAETVTVKYEIAADASTPPLLTADVPGRLAGDDRMIFTLTMPVPQLPPGRYVLRAVVSAATRPIKTLARSFSVVPPAVLMTPADSGAPAPVVVDLFLPVDDQALARPLVREDTLVADVLKPFEARVPPSTKAAFDAGIAALKAKDYGKAQTSLKAAIQPDVDSTSALTYLGVLYAITGNEAPAAGAWQTALVDGNDMPQIYEWLAQSLIRSRNLPEARGTLEEASMKWPTDPRFTGLLAQVYATLGRGVEAVRLLERYLETRKDDAESLRMGVEWLYQVHSSGSVVRTPAADLKLAHEWADRYGAGPQQALVRQWVDYLDRQSK